MDYVLFAMASFISFVVAVLYYRESEKNRDLERRLGETIMREHERKNEQDIEARFSGRSDADIFSEAVKRGLDSEVPEPPRDKGRKQ